MINENSRKLLDLCAQVGMDPELQKDVRKASETVDTAMAAAEFLRSHGVHLGEPVPPTFVYLIRCEVTGYHKIGKANDPEARLRELQCGSASKLRLRLTIPAKKRDGVNLEQALHTHFWNRRVRGEWFMLTREEVADLAAGNLPPAAQRWAK